MDHPREITIIILVVADHAVDLENICRSAAEPLHAIGGSIAKIERVPKDRPRITGAIRRALDDARVNMIVTLGGTGLEPRDNTPEVTGNLLDKEVAGIGERLRFVLGGSDPRARLSRCVAGIRNDKLIVNIPGTVSAGDGLRAIQDVILPALGCIKKPPVAVGE